MANQWGALSVSTMASNAGVCACKKRGVKSEKKGQERRARGWKRGEKKTNKDDKKDLYPNKQLSVLPPRLNAHSNEVEVLGTLHSQTLCVWQWMTKNKSQVKTQTNHTHSVLLGFALCV